MFPPALLGRLITVPYYPLSDAMMGDIIRLQLERIATRIAEQHKAAFSYDEDVVKLIASRCTEPESGGRMIDAILTNTMLPAISAAMLERMVEGAAVASVQVGVAAASSATRMRDRMAEPPGNAWLRNLVGN